MQRFIANPQWMWVRVHSRCFSYLIFFNKLSIEDRDGKTDYIYIRENIEYSWCLSLFSFN